MVPAIAPPPDFRSVGQPVRRTGGGTAFGSALRTVLKSISRPAMISAAARPIVLPDAPQEDERDRSARRSAKDLLDELEQLQRDLLRSGVPAARLLRISALAGELSPADGALAEICTALVLRARVEAARLQAAGAVRSRQAMNSRTG